MKANVISNNAILLGIFSWFVLTTIGNLTTNIASRFFVVSGRLISIIIFLVTIGVLFILRKINYKHFFSLLLYLALVAYGIFMSVLNDAIEMEKHFLFINVLITISGIFLFCYIDNSIVNKKFFYKLTKYIVWYVLIGFFVTIIIGGFEISFPPKFNFEYQSQLETETLYSQGISRFFGYGAIAAVFMYAISNSYIKKILLLILVLVFLTLSLLGGARGDSIAALLVIIGYFIFKYKFKIFLFLVGIGIIVYLYFEDLLFFLENFIIFNRLLVLMEGDYGLRDILLRQALEIIFNNPLNLIIGGGFGFFQSYYGYEHGLYPHNFLIESVLVFGLPITLIIGILVISGLKVYISKKGVDLFVLMYIYSTLIALKSGELLSHWFFIVLSVTFAIMFINKLKFIHISGEMKNYAK